jgi:hypothetical protein
MATKSTKHERPRRAREASRGGDEARRATPPEPAPLDIYGEPAGPCCDVGGWA